MKKQPIFSTQKTLFSIVFSLFLTNISLSILGPFFPIQADLYGIDQSKIGAIFSGFPLGALFCTFALRKQMSLNRKFYMITGVLLQVCGMVGFGLIFKLGQEESIIGVAICLRILMGIGMSMVETPSLSIIPLIFPYEMDSKLALIEGIQSLGLMIGPLLGSLFYYLGGYELPFYCLAALQLTSLPFLIAYIPHIDVLRLSMRMQKETGLLENDEIMEEFIDEMEKINVEDSSIKGFRCMKNYKIFVHFSMIFLTASGFLFLDSTFAVYLTNQYGLPQHLVSYIFVLSNLCSTFSCRIVSHFSEKQFESFNFTVIGFLVSIIFYLLIGPASITQLSPILILTIISRCIISICQAMVYVPAIKHFVSLITSISPLSDSEVIANLASTLYITSQQTGELIGPLVGDYLCEYESFSEASFYLATFNILAITLIFVFKRLFPVNQKQEEQYRSQFYSFYDSLIVKQESFLRTDSKILTQASNTQEEGHQ